MAAAELLPTTALLLAASRPPASSMTTAAGGTHWLDLRLCWAWANLGACACPAAQQHQRSHVGAMALLTLDQWGWPGCCYTNCYEKEQPHGCNRCSSGEHGRVTACCLQRLEAAQGGGGKGILSRRLHPRPRRPGNSLGGLPHAAASCSTGWAASRLQVPSFRRFL